MGVHRGLGVHISFVRSISMDAFKQAEILRMQHGGNKAWQDFFNDNNPSGSTFEETTIKERYESETGEEWKERLSAKVEERPFDKGKFLKERETIRKKALEKSESRSQTPVGMNRVSSNKSNSRSGSPALPNSRKTQNEAYFARMGEQNASRPDDLPPSQGGKYGGFGSGPMPQPTNEGQSGMPRADEFQSDPMAALSKGFGWFGGMVSKQAKAVNDSYLQPGFKTVASSDFASQAKTLGTQVGQGIQTGAKGAADKFNQFVEGQDERAASRANRSEPERKDFWDSFGASNTPTSTQSSTIGTSAMKKGSGPAGGASKGKEEGWGEDW
ncbi:MAG: hypothetical protein Q9227_004400 [Pyrenula ochraceoflavens]